jgi:hypothetical protein
MDKINARSNKTPEMICIILLFLGGTGAEDGPRDNDGAEAEDDDLMSVYKKKI